MKKSIKELKEERAALAARMSQMLDVAEEREAKGFTPEERAQYDGLKREYEALDERIALLEEDEARAAASARRIVGDSGKTAAERAAQHQEELRSAFFDLVLGTATKSDIKPELRAELFTSAADNQIIIPKLVADQVVHALKSTGTFLEAVDLVITQDGAPYTKGTVNTTEMPLTLADEGEDADEDKIQFGGVSFSAYDYKTPVFPVSLSLLEGTNIDVEAEIIQAITDCVRRGLEIVATRTGTGSKQMNALLNAATKGVTASSATAVTYDNMVDLMSSVDNAYGNSADGRFMFNSSTKGALMKVRNENGDPLFIADARTGDLSYILGRRVIINEAMPDIGAGAKPIAFGNFRYYHLRMVKGIRLTIFKEKYASQLMVGFMGYVRADGNLVDAGTHPVKYLEMAGA